MDEENEFFGLPDDSEEAFAVWHKRKMGELKKAYEEGNNTRYDERVYIDKMIAFDDVYGLNILGGMRSPPRGDRGFDEFFNDFRRHCEMTALKIQMEAARRQKAGVSTVVVLSVPSREAIHKLISQIREQIYAINVPDALRHSLLAKLNLFAAEVDKQQTRTEALYAGIMQAARAAREVSEELEPVVKRLDRISHWIEKADKMADKLLPWRERREIEKPQGRIEKQKPNYDLDDDIPF
ncbi:hypothetical protein [Methylorubrum thiocyanatum]|uniref:hypothetical protein n=1 Tax=Methylorubrum thiocyanatum TaxID=47958 RepID=UPI00365BF01D